MHRGGDRPAEVAVMPGLVAVADLRIHALWVRQHEAVFPGVLHQPATGFRRPPVIAADGPWIAATGGLEVERRAQLVLRMARPRRSDGRPRIPESRHPAVEA